MNLPFIHAGHCRSSTRRAVTTAASLHGNSHATNSSCPRRSFDTCFHTISAAITPPVQWLELVAIFSQAILVSDHSLRAVPPSFSLSSHSDLTTLLYRGFTKVTLPSLHAIPRLPESTVTIEWLRGRLSARPHDAQLLNNFLESYVDKLKSPSSGRRASRGLQSV